MITYEPIFDTLREKGYSSIYQLLKFGVNGETINRLRKDKPITTTTLDDLCNILECDLNGIIKYVRIE